MLKEHLQDTLHAIINNVPYAVWLKDTEGTYVLVNKAYEEFYGIKLEDLKVKDVMFTLEQKGLTFDNTVENLEDMDNRVIVENKAITIETEMQINKELHHIKITKSPVYNDTNEIIGILGVSQDITDEKRRLIKELKLAKEIQISNLPQVFPAYPDRADFDIYATLRPSKKVGGDFYDFYFISPNALAFVVADVSNKGIPAVMSMIKAKSAIRNSLISSPYVSSTVMEKINNIICQNNEDWTFVTTGLGIINLETGDVVYFNAGHTHPIIKTLDGTIKTITPPVNIALGLFENMKFEPVSFKLNAGDTLFVYNDGITESANTNGDCFGENKLVEAINSVGNNPRNIVNSVEQALKDFSDGVEQVDDLTMLAYTYYGRETYINKTLIPTRVSELIDFNSWIEGCCSTCKLEEEQKSKILMAVEEIFVNIAYYAYPDIKKDKIQETTVYFKYLKPTKEVILTFIDSGEEYNPLVETLNPVSTQIEEEKEVGGLGLAMVKNLSDTLWYEYINSQNVLNIKFKV